jgi:hypothetical protein
MDCPSCGLTNPPEAPRCDCGYDFSAGKAADFPGWEISLAWRQKVAAFWSISWLAWIGSVGLVILFTSGYSVDLLQDNLSVIALGSNLAFFAIQALLTRRLVRKNYRSFRLYVVRDDGSKSRTLSIREAVSVWLWILGPQLALLLLGSLVIWFCGTKLPPDTVRVFPSISLWLRFLVVGPYAVGLALRSRHPAFRLEAHGFRYV